MTGIKLVGEMCQAQLKDVFVGSTQIEFTPGKIRGGHYKADIKTAGTISLLMQVALPCALMADAPVTLDLRGGTNIENAPHVDYMDMIFRPLLQKFGADFTLQIHKRGYFPKGGGHVTMTITPIKRLNSITLLDPGTVSTVKGISFVAGVLPLKLANVTCEGFKEKLQNECKELNIRCYKEDTEISPYSCCGMVVSCSLSGGDNGSGGYIVGGNVLVPRGVKAGQEEARKAGQQLGDQLAATLRARSCLDHHAQDQVILYMALADGKSAVRTEKLTLHTKTAIHIVESITKIKFNVHSNDDHDIIECEGLGYTNENIKGLKRSNSSLGESNDDIEDTKRIKTIPS
ncbi:RNA 3'-terminal phosphate cyclase-like isoform X2 [Achroia grisella]|nr:RNA 3'-terminal phosphate cyclase-like isoform X2 [Achroia grisella]XP_059057587.1 RNA 3'-terminal phosphate cyclase-like isoform X2 [Achroia grisella]